MGKDTLIRALRWSERYTKTDMVYLAHGGAWLSLAQLVASLGAFILTVALANLLTQETFGEYRFLISGFLLLSIFALPGMQTALMESTPKGFRRNIEVAFREMFRFGSIGAALSACVAIYYFAQGNTSLALGFLLIAAALPFFNASSSYIQYLQALKAFRAVTVYTAITRIILLALAVAAAIYYPQHAWVILGAFLFGQIIPNLFLHRHVKRTHVSPEDIADPAIPSYAKHLTIMAALGLIAAQLDKIFLWHLIGAEELAMFYIAYAIPQEMVRFFQVIPKLAFPKFATADPMIIQKTLLAKVLKYLIFVGCSVLTYILLAPYIFRLLFPTYIDATLYSQILALGILAAAFSPIHTFLAVRKATRLLYALSIYIPIIRIASVLVLITFFGVWGAVVAILIDALARSLLLVKFLSKTLD